MTNKKGIAWACAAIVAALAVTQANHAAADTFANVKSGAAVVTAQHRTLKLECTVERVKDGGTRIVITNTRKIVLPKGTFFSYTILGDGGMKYSTFQGQIQSDLKPNERIADEFQDDIRSCRATVRLAV